MALNRLPGTPDPMHRWPGADGVRLAGDAWGPPRGPLVLLLHGGGQTRHAWKGAGEILGAAGYRVIAYDARGHGDSDWSPDGVYGEDVQVRDLKSLIAALSTESGSKPGLLKPVLIGASMGGAVSLTAVGEAHVDAHALVLVDVGPVIEKEGADKVRAFMEQRPEGFDTLDEVAEAIANYQPQRARPRNLDGLAKNVRIGSSGKYVWHWDPRRLYVTRNVMQREARLKECARRLRLPTLLVRGGLSDVLSEEGARTFLELCPHSEYVNVSDAAHMVAGDRNDKFALAAIDFLQRVAPV
jgi:pimeloyl-ACP methyl ester carboxylesterase